MRHVETSLGCNNESLIFQSVFITSNYHVNIAMRFQTPTLIKCNRILRHSREITYQAPSQRATYATRLISVGRRVGGAWGRGYMFAGL